MTILSRFTKFLKGAVTAAVAVASLTATTVSADNTPRFNQIEGDKELLTGRNVTQGQTEYGDPVSATDNDVVRVRVWYHNDANQEDGNPGAAAINTRVQVMLPDYGVSEGSTTHLLSATVGADNAATVAGTIVNGQEVGQPGLRITTDSITKVAFLPGTVKWYPNGSASPVALPNGQSGDEIVGGGLALGDIEGCWQFSGSITLDVTINPAGNPLIVREKQAVNETQGNVPAHTVAANPGDVIKYSLITRNTGNRVQTDLVVSDDIRDILEYAEVVDLGNGTVANGVISYAAETLAPGAEVIHTFKVRVKPSDQWAASGNFVMTNVYGNVVDVPVKPPVKPLDLTIKKELRVLSEGGAFVKQVTTNRGETIEYRLIIKNTGKEQLSKVRIKDIHDSKLGFISGTVTLTRDGKTASISDALVSADGYLLDSPLRVNEEITIKFRMKVDTAAGDNARLCNDGSVSAEGVGPKQDTACVTVNPLVTPITTPTTPAGPVTIPTPTLPQTGPADVMLALLGVVSGGATTVRYRRAKRAVTRAASDIAIL